jgi:hypothetical protein
MGGRMLRRPKTLQSVHPLVRAGLPASCYVKSNKPDDEVDQNMIRLLFLSTVLFYAKIRTFDAPLLTYFSSQRVHIQITPHLRINFSAWFIHIVGCIVSRSVLLSFLFHLNISPKSAIVQILSSLEDNKKWH